MKTIKQLVQQHKNFKRSNEISLIIAEVIKKEKEFIYTHPEYRLTVFEYLEFRYFLYKLKNNYPLSYITKKKEFFNLDFKISKNVLVPRPETEIMVQKAINTISKKNDKVLLIDVGTGSGCIPISILKNINKPIKTIAIDISTKALQVAKQNSEIHDVDIEFKHGNLLEPILKEDILQNYTNIVITANLPYITEKQYQKEDSIQKEPKQALVADKQGLELYVKLLYQLKKIQDQYLSLKINVLLEIDPSQAQILPNLIQKIFANARVQVIQDLAKKNRVVTISL